MTYEQGVAWLERSGFAASSSVRSRWLTSMPGGQALVEVSYVWAVGRKPWGARIGLAVGEGATPAAALRRVAKACRALCSDEMMTCGYIDGLTVTK
jgi:hypothetical protein